MTREAAVRLCNSAPVWDARLQPLVQHHHLPGRVGEGVIEINATGVSTTPDEHLGARPNRRMNETRRRRAGRADRRPTVGGGIVAGPVVKVTAIVSAPDDHFAACPHRRMISSRGGCA